ncbi:iron complex outermembrane recepter protein [Chryseolinea serpens]|uniref:Iron complex outermembrane recepter protein n=1 Tax=Chryseolinea serpens TaxID=947013 RepID=A0A1M5RJL2_9BACT|nr:TonB-dependent receptor [Chryseolinea serpens]SHH26572.1 iron complex outermembrane recepter protein [Chryseolinea serpens]
MMKLYSIARGMALLCLLATTAWAQSRTITGSVKSADDGNFLPGVNILEKGTSNGTVTDAQGNYSILVKENATLVFSFVGYASTEVQVGNQTTIAVTLSPDVSTLEEVVVVGYGTVKKTDASGSLAVVSSETFNKGVVNSPQELIMGKTAGVSVTTNSGAPGNTSTIRIRGGSSLSASNDPLIVIDGVPVSNTNLGGSPNILATLNPNDIENFTVLKDASATAIYGSRASNGVIIITTKRGGKDFKVNYSVTGTMYTAPKKVDVFSGDEYRALMNEQFPGNNAVLKLLGTANTDWQKEIFSTAYGQDHNLNLSGTAKKTPYRVSVGYNNTDGILNTYNFKRTTASIGLDPTLLDGSLKMNINVKRMYNQNNFADQAAIGNAIAYDPTQPVYNGNKRWRGYTTWTTGGPEGNSINLAPGNPVARLDMTDNTSTVKRSIGNVKFDYALPFLKDLHANLNLGYDYSETKGHNNVRDSTQWIYLPTVAGGQINPYTATAKNQLLDFYLNYSKELPNINSKIDVMGGYSWSHFYSSGADSTMNQKSEAATRVNVYETEYYLLSFFGRLNYTYKGKYILTGTLRDDATSRFAPENRWGLFPAFALAWKINEEGFMKESKTLSDLKLRLGYGITGQQDIYGNDYPYIPTYTRSDNAARYPFGSSFYNTLRPDGYDQNIKWEETTTINAGLDFGFFQNRLTGSLDVYEKKSDNLIAYIPIPVGTNFTSSLTTNVGSMKNRGIELNLSADIISTDNLQWTVGYNVTYNKNEITRLNLSNDPNFIIPLGNVGGTTSGTIQVQKVGYSRASFYAYQQIYDTNGKPIEDAYVDRNNDGVINTSDLYVYKKPDATVYMGINSRLNYKNWDFAFSGRASFGNYVYNNVAANSTYRTLYNSMEYLSNVSKLANDTKFTTALNTRFSDYYIENASFFRMDNINFGYSFRELYKEKLNVRIGAGVQNVFVITKYKGLDPEISGGLDNNFFPRTRSFFLSLNATF